ncbi:hypothetical protein [Zoogloea sp.]|uniref:hypothetical protein n=2 Tax=Zoogloea sp. TaxID=49181 RepID=UPI001D818A8A|nr:hypothetical protein [Zoogloea sp.]MBK6654519.1 hypothetical protein [Zoogloea sp.]
MNTKTKSALRSTLQKENEALEARLPDPVQDAAGAPTPAPADPVAVEAIAPSITAEPAAVAAQTPAKPAAESKPAGGAEKVTAPAVKKAAATPPARSKAVAPKPASAVKVEKSPKSVKLEKADKPVKAEKAVKADKPVKASREKVVRDSFSMPKSEHAQLKQLRETLAKAGRICTKSELLRAGVQLLLKEDVTGIRTLVERLVVVPKGKGAK